ncbi:MAG: PA2817 family protein [Oceanospirillaceae bacterium]
MNQYHFFHLELLKQTYNLLISYPPFNSEELMPQDEEFLDSFNNLIQLGDEYTQDYIESGQTFCINWVRGYSQLTPILPRDLLWFFSGDCLHYMPDEEIMQFQQLDELRYEAESSAIEFDYAKIRNEFLKLTV